MWLNFAGKATTAPRCSMKVVSMTLVLVGWGGAKNRDTMYGTLDMNDNLSARGARRQRRQSANGNATDKKGCRSTEAGAGRFSNRGQVSRMVGQGFRGFGTEDCGVAVASSDQAGMVTGRRNDTDEPRRLTALHLRLRLNDPRKAGKGCILLMVPSLNRKVKTESSGERRTFSLPCPLITSLALILNVTQTQSIAFGFDIPFPERERRSD